jgi:hypothetical protein
MLRWLFVVLLAMAGPAWGDATVRICYGYGCLVQVDIRYTEARLRELGHRLNQADDALAERQILAEVMGRLYAMAGEQSDIHNDRGGNYADGSIPGKMDCIDHSTSSTRLLRMLEARGDLRWHRVLEPEVRNFALIFPAHYSAVIEEKTDGEAARFVVDSWFVDNGQPAVILPLDEWKKGAGPDV